MTKAQMRAKARKKGEDKVPEKDRTDFMKTMPRKPKSKPKKKKKSPKY